MNKNVSTIKTTGNLKQDILSVVSGIGPISSRIAGLRGVNGFGKFIKKGDTVFLKPNFNTADPFPASTDIEFLRTVTEIVLSCGAKEVFIGDRSTYMQNGRKVMKQIGVFELEKISKNVHVMVLDEGKFIKKDIPNARFLKTAFIPEILDNIDKLILLPCLKTHMMAQFTGSLKLSVGFMKPITRLSLHMRNLQEKIAELNMIIYPTLIIMDGRKCFITGGPHKGTLREPKTLLASTNRVALDIEAIKIIQSFPGNTLAGITPSDLSQIKRAIEMGIR